MNGTQKNLGHAFQGPAVLQWTAMGWKMQNDPISLSFSPVMFPPPSYKIPPGQSIVSLDRPSPEHNNILDGASGLYTLCYVFQQMA